jgi:predicted ferric reductase
VTELAWYIARSSGIVGWLLLAASVVWGLALSTRVLAERVRANWLLDLHRFVGGVAVVFTAIHVGAVVADSYVDFSLVNVLVPFTGKWHPLAMAWGVVGFYLLAAVEITSLLRRRLSKRVWRATHYLSFPLYLVATVHLLTAGTDATNPALFWTVLLGTGLVGGLTAERLARVSATAEQDRVSPAVR